MDDLSILIKTNITWLSFVELFAKLIGSKGMDKTNDMGSLHLWHLLDFDLIAIYEPNLDDDQGIPFSSYNFLLDFVLTDCRDLELNKQFCYTLAKLLMVKIKREISQDTILVKNLQRIID
ncbi:MAG: hypothetical protein DSM107014_14065 [Gomphosphaeria aponina SAG 52.96 = DSM 107014]|uniref:Uncharacterized protein n=1 Tax=Gomphosphaeria aponina SAG 52.96 = DSM 107014 TaxID=1521640 RepID=A0A941JSU3_9CHRO|nr:hypothetical protein [Gomphosphaeria aponina SAG 52.96 = DSM 107014]